MVTVGLLVRLEAKPGKADEVAHFLEQALPLVEQEPATIAGSRSVLALRRSGSSTPSPVTRAVRHISLALSPLR